MFKKLASSLLITIIFLILSFSTTAFAAIEVTLNGEEMSIRDALTAAAGKENVEIVLLKTVTYQISGQKLNAFDFKGTIDLNGFSLKGGNGGGIRLASNADIEITNSKDAGNIYSNANTIDFEGTGAKLKLNSVDVVAGGQGATSAINITSGNSVIINGGTISNSKLGNCIMIYDGSVLEVNDATLSTASSTKAGIGIDQNCYVTIKNSTVSSKGLGIGALGDNITLEIENSTISGDSEFGISSNGSFQNINITLTNSEVTGLYGMYLPAFNSKTVLNDSIITGTKTGIEIRAGELIINGNKSDVSSLSEEYKIIPDESGATITGAAIGISQHVSKKPISVIINGGNFSGAKSLSIEAPQANDYLTNGFDLKINDGIFDGLVSFGNDVSGQPVKMENTESVKKFVYGGIFSEKIDPAYINETVDFVIPTSSSSDNTKKYYGYASSEKVEEIKAEFAQVEDYNPSEELQAFEVVKDGDQDITKPYYFIQFDLGSNGTLTTAKFNLNEVGDGLYNGTIQPDDINEAQGKFDFKELFDDLTFKRPGYEEIIEWMILNPEENFPLTQSDLTATPQKINTDGVTQLIAIWKAAALNSASLIVDKGTMDIGSREDLNTIINIEPSDTIVTINFSSSDSEVASVNETGILEAKKAGTAVITITVIPENGEPVTLIYTVTVNNITSKPSDSNKPTQPEGNTPSYPGNYFSPSTPNQPKTAEIKITQDKLSYGKVSGDKIYNIGDKATLSATPVKGYRFVGWSENNQIVSKDNPYTFIVEKDRELKAVFEKIEFEKSEPEEMIVYRIYNPTSGEHVYSTHKEEVTTRIKEGNWNYEDIAWYSPTSGIPVYRLYNPTLGTHLYTTNKNEINFLTSSEGWIPDFNGDPLFYSGGTITVYRLYNEPLHGEHLLTTDLNEYQQLPSIAQEWQQEGTSFNVIRKGK